MTRMINDYRMSSLLEEPTSEYSQEDKAFLSCVDEGGEVRTVSGPDEEHGLDEDEYVHYCFIDGKSYRGEVKKKKDKED